MFREEQLYTELGKLKSIIQKTEWKYYHLQSVENFIYHLKSFNSERTRDRMASEIEKYIKIVTEKIKETSDVHDKSKELFPAIWQISDTYKYEVGFIQKPSYLVTGILIIGFFFLLKIFFSALAALSICTLVLAIYFTYAYLKMKARKFF